MRLSVGKTDTSRGSGRFQCFLVFAAFPGTWAILACFRIRFAVSTEESLSGVDLEKKGEFAGSDSGGRLAGEIIGRKPLIFPIKMAFPILLSGGAKNPFPTPSGILCRINFWGVPDLAPLPPWQTDHERHDG